MRSVSTCASGYLEDALLQVSLMIRSGSNLLPQRAAMDTLVTGHAYLPVNGRGHCGWLSELEAYGNGGSGAPRSGLSSTRLNHGTG